MSTDRELLEEARELFEDCVNLLYMDGWHINADKINVFLRRLDQHKQSQEIPESLSGANVSEGVTGEERPAQSQVGEEPTSGAAESRTPSAGETDLGSSPQSQVSQVGEEPVQEDSRCGLAPGAQERPRTAGNQTGPDEGTKDLPGTGAPTGSSPQPPFCGCGCDEAAHGIRGSCRHKCVPHTKTQPPSDVLSEEMFRVKVNYYATHSRLGDHRKAKECWDEVMTHDRALRQRVEALQGEVVAAWSQYRHARADVVLSKESVVMRENDELKKRCAELLQAAEAVEVQLAEGYDSYDGQWINGDIRDQLNKAIAAAKKLQEGGE